MKTLLKNQTLIPITLFVIGIFGILFYFLNNLSFSDSTVTFSQKKIKSLEKDSFIIQEFNSNRDGLSQINLNLERVNQAPSDNILIKLLTEDCGSEIAAERISARTLDTSTFYKFKFNRLLNSKDKRLCLKITSEASQLNDPTFSVVISESVNDIYLKNLEQKKGMVIMRPSFNNESLSQDLIELDQRLSQYKPWFYKKFYWLIIFITMITSICFLFFKLIKI